MDQQGGWLRAPEFEVLSREEYNALLRAAGSARALVRSQPRLARCILPLDFSPTFAHVFVDTCDLEDLEFALAHGAPVNVHNSHHDAGLTALHCAAAEGNVAGIRLLVRAGADVGRSTLSDHMTPMQVAAEEDQAEAVRVLLDLGAPVCYVNESDFFPEAQWPGKALRELGAIFVDYGARALPLVRCLHPNVLRLLAECEGVLVPPARFPYYSREYATRWAAGETELQAERVAVERAAAASLPPVLVGVVGDYVHALPREWLVEPLAAS